MERLITLNCIFYRTMSTTINFNDIRPVDGSIEDGFEEFCCQMFRLLVDVPEASTFTRKGKQDSAIECYWELPNGDKWGLQAKFHTTGPINPILNQINFKEAVKEHPNLTKFIVCIPYNLPDSSRDNVKTALDRWEEKKSDWVKHIDKGYGDRNVEIEYWGKSDLIDFLNQDRFRGRQYFWFEKEQLTIEKLEREINATIEDARDRYSPDLHVDVGIENIFDSIGLTPKFFERLEEKLDALNKKKEKLLVPAHIQVMENIDKDTYREIEECLENTLNLIRNNFTNIEYLYENFPIRKVIKTLENLHSSKLGEIEAALLEKEDKESIEIDTVNSITNLRTEIIDFIRFLKGNLKENNLSVIERGKMKLLGEAGAGRACWTGYWHREKYIRYRRCNF